MQQKHVNFNKLYHDDEWVDRKVNHTKLYDYSNVESIVAFSDSHPKIMEQRIKKLNWKADLDVNKKSFKTKDRLLYWIERSTGLRLFEYQNYKVV